MSSNSYGDVNSNSTPIIVFQGTTGSAEVPVTVVIKALPANSASVWVGTDASVASTTGFPLAAGESLTIELTGLDSVWVVSAASQHVRFIALGA